MKTAQLRNTRALNEYLHKTEIRVRSWAPGDGQIRYRFFHMNEDGTYPEFHEGDGFRTELGFGNAERVAFGIMVGVNECC